jgi:hypothetical protein
VKATPAPGARLFAPRGILPLLAAFAAFAALAPRARSDDSRKKQEILFTEMAARTVDDPPFFLVAKATSKLPVAFEVIAGPAVLDGRKITLTGASGLVIIRASQEGNADFQPAVDTERVLVVRPRPVAPRITSQPGTASVAIGEPLILTVRVSGEPEPALQWRKDGNAVVGAEARSLSIPAASPSDAGTYDVVATNSAGEATSMRVRVSVAKRRQTITFQAPGITVAGQPVMLSAFASSGLPVQFDIVSGVATLSAGVLTSQAGTVTVEASQQGNTSFEPAPPVMQTLTFSANGIQHAQ